MKTYVPTPFAICIVLLLPSVVSAQSRIRRLAPANAGTGPYDLTSTVGVTEYGNQFIRELVHAARLAAELRDAVHDRNTIAASRLFNDLGALFARNPKGPLNAFRDNFGRLIGAYLAKTQIAGDIETAADNLDKTICVTLNGKTTEQRLPVGSLKVGSYWRPFGAYGFETLSDGAVDQSLPGNKRLSFTECAAESAIVPTSGEITPGSAHVVAGIAFGDPDNWVATGSFGAFLSPYGLDSQGSLTVRIVKPDEDPPQAEADADSLTPIEVRFAKSARKRNLLDHVRAGDLWLYGSVRSISVNGVTPSVQGTVSEAALTWALPARPLHADPDQNPIGSTTLTVSGIYCPQRQFAVDEMGFELRTPLGTRNWQKPIYFGARYGTRGSLTLSIEGRL